MTRETKLRTGERLTGEAVAELRAGDVLRFEPGECLAIFVRTAQDALRPDLIAWQPKPLHMVRHNKPGAFTFIARPGVWTDWSGGECPIGDIPVAVRFRSGRERDDHTAYRWDWEHNSTPDQRDIIAFRIPAPTPAAIEPEDPFGPLDNRWISEAPSTEAGGLEVVGVVSGTARADLFTADLPEGTNLTDHAPAENLVAELRSDLAVAVEIVSVCLTALDVSREGGEYPDFEAWETKARQALARLKQKGVGE